MVKSRRIFALFFVAVFVAVSFVIPCFAISGGSSPGSSYQQAGLAFDTISFNLSSAASSTPLLDGPRAVASWPFNNAGSSVVHVQQEFYESEASLFAASVYSELGNIKGSFTLNRSGFFQLSSRYMYFSNASTLQIGGAGDDGPQGFSRVIISYNLLDIEDSVGGTYYEADVTPCYYDSSSDGFVLPSTLDIGDLIVRAYFYSTGKEFLSGYTKLLSDVSVIVFFSGSAIGPGATFTVLVSGESEGNFSSYISNERLVLKLDAGLFDWLLQSVDAFLNLEIAPDFSINEMFWIVLVIGIILWFITALI